MSGECPECGGETAPLYLGHENPQTVGISGPGMDGTGTEFIPVGGWVYCLDCARPVEVR